MSYLKEIEYEILLENSYKIIRNCPKCRRKMRYQSTHNFRVNANGTQIDIWLIYQCEKCKHTYNITIYERIKPSFIDKEKYNKFLNNDSLLAEEYGKNKELFQKNHAEIDWESISYKIFSKNSEVPKYGDCIIIKNPYQIKLRMGKVLAEILNITRSEVRQRIKEKKIILEQKDWKEEKYILLYQYYVKDLRK